MALVGVGTVSKAESRSSQAAGRLIGPVLPAAAGLAAVAQVVQGEGNVLLLSARDVSHEFGSRVLFGGFDFTIDRGDRVGLVGRNGAGKTTLLRILSGELGGSGSVERPGTLGYLPQDPRAADPEMTALTRVLSGRDLDVIFRSLTDSQQRLGSCDPGEKAALLKAYGEAETLFAAREGYRAEADAATIAANLGLAAGVLSQQLGTLSGGQRRRIELARILFSEADLLLLDEPTNHLDADSIAWLTSYLKAFGGGLVVISHDAELLQAVCNRILFLDAVRSEVIPYSMGYRSYLVRRAEDEARLAKEEEQIFGRAAQLKRQADRMRGSSAKRARTAKVLDRRAERLVESFDGQRSGHERVARIRFPPPAPSSRVVLEGEGLVKAYGSLEVISGLDIVVERGEKMLVIGLNGAGKTTLLRLLAGVEAPDAGELVLGRGAILGYYTQEHESLDQEASVFENLRRLAPVTLTDADLRAVLGSFLFGKDTYEQPAGTLSGGEKTRLALATLVGTRSNVLLLDEPTNNLDPASRDRVLAALGDYEGSVVLVTHDPGAVTALRPDRVLLLPDGVEDYWSPELLDLVTLS